MEVQCDSKLSVCSSWLHQPTRQCNDKYSCLCHIATVFVVGYWIHSGMHWTGLLMFVCALLYIIWIVNFSLDRRVARSHGCNIYRWWSNTPIGSDCKEGIQELATWCHGNCYFNLVAFLALIWYNLVFGGNQVAVTYMSIMIIFILLLGIIVFHVLL